MMKKKKSFKIDNIAYAPLGNELGYCLGENDETHGKHIYYFKGYPDRKYLKCEIVLMSEADVVDTFNYGDERMECGADKNHKYFNKTYKFDDVHYI